MVLPAGFSLKVIETKIGLKFAITEPPEPTLKVTGFVVPDASPPQLWNW